MSIWALYAIMLHLRLGSPSGLNINVIVPAGTRPGAKLPVAAVSPIYITSLQSSHNLDAVVDLRRYVPFPFVRRGGDSLIVRGLSGRLERRVSSISVFTAKFLAERGILVSQEWWS